MEVKEVDNKYNGWHEQHTADDDINNSWHNFSRDTLSELDLHGKTLLEIGCGRGGFSNYVGKNFPQINKLYACDYSVSGVQIGKEKYGTFNNRVEWKQQDIMNMEFADNSIDVAISCETIEHIPDSNKGIKELARVIKPGGYLILTCPNYFNLFGIWCAYRKIIGKPYDEGGQPFVKYILMPFIYAKIKRAGFKIIKFQSSDLTIPARRPKHFYMKRLPKAIAFLGLQSCYILQKR
jgi:ubiquinone/menaquinone biosynthesis C-methylase UbiE